jgi:hypothetical protein
MEILSAYTGAIFHKNFQLFEVYTNAVSHDAHGGIQNNRLAA